MDTHHSNKKVNLSIHFRKVQRKGRSAWSFDYNCIICGFHRSNVNKVIKHMRDCHTKTQLARFNVDWLVELYGKVQVPQSPCHESKQMIPYAKIALHSTQCKNCSVVTTMVDRVYQCCETFDDPDCMDDNLRLIGEAVQLLDGMERVAKTLDLPLMH